MGLDDELHWSEVYDKLQECKKNLEVALEKRNYWFQQYLLFKDSAEAFAGRIAQLEREVKSIKESNQVLDTHAKGLEEKIREQQVMIDDYIITISSYQSEDEEIVVHDDFAQKIEQQDRDDIDRLGSDNG